MKVRLENQEIRFRISDEELALLIGGSMLSVHVIFGDGSINTHSYTIMASGEVKTITLKVSNGIFEVLFPKDYIEVWDDKKIGFEDIIKIGDTKDLKIVVEKDLRKRKRA